MNVSCDKAVCVPLISLPNDESCRNHRNCRLPWYPVSLQVCVNLWPQLYIKRLREAMWSNCILRQSLHLLQVPKIVSCSLCFPQPLFIPPETVGSVPGSLLQSSPAPATVSWLMLTWSLLNPINPLCVFVWFVSPVNCTAGRYYLSNICNKKIAKKTPTSQTWQGGQDQWLELSEELPCPWFCIT